MALRDVRDALLYAYDDGDINDDEFCMLYDLNKSRDDYNKCTFTANVKGES